MRISDLSSDVCSSDLPDAPAADYGSDRLFALLTLDGEDVSRLTQQADALVAAGQPMVRITLASKDLIGQEFFRWEAIGRASCRERVCQYVYTSVVAVSSK